MKKMICLLALLFLAAPALADIQFYGTDVGSGQIKIGYRVVEPNAVAPRAIALSLDFDRDNNVATLQGDTATSGVVSKDAVHFRFYPDYANSLADPNLIETGYDPDTGYYASAHPFGKLDAAGEPASFVGGLAEVDYCVAKLSNPPAPGPSSGDFDLITLQLDPHGAASTIVRIDENDLRGGVVGSSLVTNLPIDVPVAFGCTCLGDYDSSNKVNATDVIAIVSLINNYGAGKPKSILPADTTHWNDCADATNDDKINASDIIKIISWINNYGSGKPKSVTCPHSLP